MTLPPPKMAARGDGARAAELSPRQGATSSRGLGVPKSRFQSFKALSFLHLHNIWFFHFSSACSYSFKREASSPFSYLPWVEPGWLCLTAAPSLQPPSLRCHGFAPGATSPVLTCAGLGLLLLTSWPRLRGSGIPDAALPGRVPGSLPLCPRLPTAGARSPTQSALAHWESQRFVGRRQEGVLTERAGIDCLQPNPGCTTD